MDGRRDYYNNTDYNVVDAEYEPMREKQARKSPSRHSQSHRDDPPPPPRDFGAETDLLVLHYRKLFILPFLLLLVAVIMMSATQYPDPPEIEDYEDEEDPTDAWRTDMDEFNDTVEDVNTTADLLFTIGILILAFLFFMGGFIDRRVSSPARVAMMILAVVIIALFLSDGFKLQALFG